MELREGTAEHGPGWALSHFPPTGCCTLDAGGRSPFGSDGRLQKYVGDRVQNFLGVSVRDNATKGQVWEVDEAADGRAGGCQIASLRGGTRSCSPHTGIGNSLGASGSNDRDRPGPVSVSPDIFFWSVIRPWSRASGRGGHPGMWTSTGR